MGAFMAKIGEWLGKYVVQYLIRYVVDHVTAWLERRRADQRQRKKDEENKIKYDQAVKEGTHEDIQNQTEDRLNGN